MRAADADADADAETLERARLIEVERRARRAAEEALEMRDRVLVAISHDLKNPLTVIRAQAQVLARRYAVQLPPEDGQRLAAGLAQIQTEVRRMTRWLDELSDTARLQIGQALPLDRLPVDLVDLLQRVAAEQQRGADLHHIGVHCAMPRLVGDWDEARLERVLVNLIDNAVKYSPAGGVVSVTLEVAGDGADIGADNAGADAPSDGPWAIVRVADQGIGIPAPAITRVFEPYYRAENAAGAGPGTGLGLFSVRHIVERHAGTVDVESREGQGSTFIVRLPIVPPRGATPPTPSSASSSSSSSP